MRRRNYRVQVVPGLVARGEVGEGALPFDLLPQLGHVGVALRGGGSHDAQRAVDVVDGHHCNREKGGGGSGFHSGNRAARSATLRMDFRKTRSCSF